MAYGGGAFNINSKYVILFYSIIYISSIFMFLYLYIFVLYVFICVRIKEEANNRIGCWMWGVLTRSVRFPAVWTCLTSQTTFMSCTLLPSPLMLHWGIPSFVLLFSFVSLTSPSSFSCYIYYLLIYYINRKGSANSVFSFYLHKASRSSFVALVVFIVPFRMPLYFSLLLFPLLLFIYFGC